MIKVAYQCAWCSKVTGSSVFQSDETDDVIISHTICRRCKKTLLEQTSHLLSKKVIRNETDTKGERP